jgi:3-methyladenine DNA glycosylase/8-oxoguanine DNA glycosylase
MFTYYRNNVLAKTDFGVLSGIQKVYSEAKIDANFLNLLHERLGEYATLFTFCM